MHNAAFEESFAPGANIKNSTKKTAFGLNAWKSILKSALSLQKHQHRSEKWIIVHGQGLVIIDEEEIPVSPGTVVDVPLGAVHRIGNPYEHPLIFIEVACGKYLGEDDIIRIQDDYTRQ